MGRPTKPKLKHGTFYSYKKKGCRCPKCRARMNEATQDYRNRPLKTKDLTHGTRSAYNNGCRCEACTSANAAYAKVWKQKSVAAA